MEILEEDVVDELSDLKKQAKHLHANQASPDIEGHGWVQTYRQWVEEKLQKEVLTGQEHAARYTTTPTTDQLKELHIIRRTAAILHEESHLVSQGVNVPEIATEYGETVAGGCR